MFHNAKEELADLRTEGLMRVEAYAHERRSDMWENFFGEASPREVAEALSQGLTPMKLNVLHADDDGGALVMFSLRSGTERNSRVASGGFSVYLDETPAWIELHDFHVLNPYARGQGVGRQFLTNLREMMELPEIGASLIRIDARMVGAYAWARFGFVPDPEEWQALKPYLASRLNEMGNELGKDDIRLVNKLLQSDDPKALWAVADLGGQYDSTEHGRQTMTLGQRLLLNNGWKGALDLNDEESRERFEAYTTPMKMLPSPAPTPHARRA